MKKIDLPYLIEYLSNKHPPRNFLADAPLIHRGHVPMAAYLVCDGTVLRGKSLRRMGTVPKGTLLALEGILGREPYDWHIHVKAGARLSILDHTDLAQLHQLASRQEDEGVEIYKELQRLFKILPNL